MRKTKYENITTKRILEILHQTKPLNFKLHEHPKLKTRLQAKYVRENNQNVIKYKQLYTTGYKMNIKPKKIVYTTTENKTRFDYTTTIRNKTKEHSLYIKGRYKGKTTDYEVNLFIQKELKKINDELNKNTTR